MQITLKDKAGNRRLVMIADQEDGQLPTAALDFQTRKVFILSGSNEYVEVSHAIADVPPPSPPAGQSVDPSQAPAIETNQPQQG